MMPKWPKSMKHVCIYKNLNSFYLTRPQNILSPLPPEIQTPQTDATLTQHTCPKQFQKQELHKELEK